jgi:hypothetical protein
MLALLSHRTPLPAADPRPHASGTAAARCPRSSCPDGTPRARPSWAATAVPGAIRGQATVHPEPRRTRHQRFDPTRSNPSARRAASMRLWELWQALAGWPALVGSGRDTASQAEALFHHPPSRAGRDWSREWRMPGPWPIAATVGHPDDTVSFHEPAVFRSLLPAFWWESGGVFAPDPRPHGNVRPDRAIRAQHVYHGRSPSTARWGSTGILWMNGARVARPSGLRSRRARCRVSA